jgi:hypothetical protein
MWTEHNDVRTVGYVADTGNTYQVLLLVVAVRTVPRRNLGLEFHVQYSTVLYSVEYSGAYSINNGTFWP